MCAWMLGLLTGSEKVARSVGTDGMCISRMKLPVSQSTCSCTGLSFIISARCLGVVACGVVMVGMKFVSQNAVEKTCERTIRQHRQLLCRLACTWFAAAWPAVASAVPMRPTQNRSTDCTKAPTRRARERSVKKISVCRTSLDEQKNSLEHGDAGRGEEEAEVTGPSVDLRDWQYEEVDDGRGGERQDPAIERVACCV
eukprot:6187417-Pleurochrysis_carterae.AAC.1